MFRIVEGRVFDSNCVLHVFSSWVVNIHFNIQSAVTVRNVASGVDSGEGSFKFKSTSLASASTPNQESNQREMPYKILGK